MLASFACDQGQRKVTIRFKFKQGMKLDYRQTAKGSLQSYRADSLMSDRFNEYTVLLGWYVRRVLDDGTAEIVESKDFKLTATDKSSPGRADTVTEQREIIMYVKPNGKVEDLEYSNGEQKSKVTYMKNYIEQGQPVFPARELREGDSWTQTTKVILPDGPMDASTTYEITSFARERGYDCVIIAYDGNLIIPLDKMSEEHYKMLSGVDNIHASGHIYFAYEEGMIVRQTEKWLMNGERTWEVLSPDTSKESYRNLKPGDTVTNKVVLEYDVNHVLVDVTRE